jgi:hypothetical protein
LRSLRKNLHHTDARQHFLQVAVQARQPRAHDAVRIARPAAEPQADRDQHRHQDQHDQRELPAQQEQHAEQQDDAQEVEAELDQAPT